MVNSASVVAALVLSLFGTSPTETKGAARHPAAAPVQVAAGMKLWSPKKPSPKAKGGDDGDTSRDKEEEALLKPRAPTPASSPGPRPRRRIKMEEASSAADADEESEDEEEEDRPRVKKRKRVVEEEEEDEEEEEEDVPLPSLPVVRPRLAGIEIGGAALGRSFAFNTPLQKDSAFPRMGFLVAGEAFPLMRTPPGFQRHLGIGFAYERQTGTAGKLAMGDGSTVTYPVTQSRLGFDVRYFFALGPRVLLMPAAGYGKIAADLVRRTPVAASTCTTDFAQPCFPSANAAYLSADLHLRIAVTPEFALSLVPGYMLGLGVTKADGQISSSEATASMQGFHVDVGASLLIKEWFAVTAAVPIRRFAYTFAATSGGAATYASATDIYYGLVAGVALRAP